MEPSEVVTSASEPDPTILRAASLPGCVEVCLETIGHRPDSILLFHNGETAQLRHALQHRVVELDDRSQVFHRFLHLDLSTGYSEAGWIDGQGRRATL